MSGTDQQTAPDWRAEVDQWWAEVLHVPVAALRSGGLFTLDHVDHVGILAVDRSDAQIIYGPGWALPASTAILRAGPVDLSEGQHLAATLGPRARRFLGPAWYGYVTEQTLGPLPGSEVRQLGESDLPLLARLRDRAPPAEREESGTTDLPAYGYLSEGELL